MTIYRPTNNRPRTAGLAVLAVFFVVMIYGFAASAWVARELGYVPALGRPLYAHLYPPFDWLVWSFRYYRADPPLFAHTYLGLVIVTVITLATAVITVGIKSRTLTPYTDAQGSARFLDSDDEIRETGLLPVAGREDTASGILLGVWDEPRRSLLGRRVRHYIRHPQIEHIQLFGPPGSGKGVAFVYNAINTWDSSMVVLDRKGSLHAMASGFLEKSKYRVLRWAPLDPNNTIGINILDAIRVGTPFEVGDSINFAKAMIPTTGGGEHTFFTDAAARLLAGVVLYTVMKCRAEGKRATLADLVGMFGAAHGSNLDLYNAMLNNELGPAENGEKTAHPWIKEMGSVALKGSKSERTDANIFETAFQKLFAATDPQVQAATKESDFHLEDLMNGPEKIALFLVLPPGESDTQRLSGIFTTILSMMIEVPMRREIRPENGNTKIPHDRPLMMLLDEIGNVGRINSLPGALTQLREYGVKIIGIWQSLTQITKNYGPNNPILGASEIQMSFAPNDKETADWLSGRLGKATINLVNTQMSGHRFGWGMHNVSQSIETRQRDLMTPDETMRLPGPKKDSNNKVMSPGQILIIKRGEQPIRATQALWWEIPAIAARASISPVEAADTRSNKPPSPPAPPTPEQNNAAPSYRAPKASPRPRRIGPQSPPKPAS